MILCPGMEFLFCHLIRFPAVAICGYYFMPCFVRLRYLFGLDVPVGVRRSKELLEVNLIVFSVHIMLFGRALAQSNLLSLRFLIL